MQVNKSFSPEPKYRFNLKFPSFTKPNEIGFFSLDAENNFHNDQREVKYLCISKELQLALNFNLKLGYERFIPKLDVSNKIDNILQWITINYQKYKSVTHSCVKSQFVFWRGLFTKILYTPYENIEDWIICVTLFQGSYYLCDFETDRKKNLEKNRSEFDKLLCYGGYKFETFITSASPSGKSRQNDIVNEHRSYSTVIYSELNNHSLLYAAEVDGIDPESNEKAPKNYIELKTTKITKNDFQERNFRRYKLGKWWCQSFTIGIPTIICGYRDDNCTVRYLKTFEVKNIPRKVEKDLWNPNISFNFCDQFLKFIKAVVLKDDPNIVYRFDWSPGGRAIYVKEEPDPFYKILPDWYISFREHNQ